MSSLLELLGPWKTLYWALPATLALVYLLSLWRDWTVVVLLVVVLYICLATVVFVVLMRLVAAMFSTVVTLLSIAMAVAIVVIARRSKQLKSLIWCNVRVMIGQMQVLSLLYTSLDITFPPPFGKGADYVGFLSIDTGRLVTVLELECVTEIDYYTRWLIEVVGVPLIAATFTMVCYGYERSLAHYATPYWNRVRLCCTRVLNYVCCAQSQAISHWATFNTDLDPESDDRKRNTDGCMSVDARPHSRTASPDYDCASYSYAYSLRELYRMGFKDAEDALEEADGNQDVDLDLAARKNRFDRAFDQLRSARAARRWKQLASLWIFILYAPTSSAIVKMFQCRTLGEDLSVLVEDNQIHCCDSQYHYYKWFAAILVPVVPVGIPAMIIFWMRQNFRKNRAVASMEALVIAEFEKFEHSGSATTSHTKLQTGDMDPSVTDPHIRLSHSSAQQLVSRIRAQVFGHASEPTLTTEDTLTLHDVRSCTARSLALLLIARASPSRLEKVQEQHKANPTDTASIDRPRGCCGPVDRLPDGTTPDLIQIIRDPRNRYNMKHFGRYLFFIVHRSFFSFCVASVTIDFSACSRFRLFSHVL
eukprot:COSAG01_NODE_3820_length_5664_cov_3.383827_3_plen_590_part_00